MADRPESEQNQALTQRQPIFNVPLVVLALLGLMLAVHVAKTFALNESGNEALVLWLAFIPYRLIGPDQIEGGWLPLIWTPFTHAFLHAGWDHLLINVAWLAIFGTPVARRYGTLAALALFLISTAAGAVLFAATTLPSVQLLIGASGGIAGLTGVACRFVFQPVLTHRDAETGDVHVLGRRTATLADLVRDGRARMFIGLWLVLNAAVPFVPMLFGQDIGIAWQAHLGGFLAGLLLTPMFDRRAPQEVAP